MSMPPGGGGGGTLTDQLASLIKGGGNGRRLFGRRQRRFAWRQDTITIEQAGTRMLPGNTRRLLLVFAPNDSADYWVAPGNIEGTNQGLNVDATGVNLIVPKHIYGPIVEASWHGIPSAVQLDVWTLELWEI